MTGTENKVSTVISGRKPMSNKQLRKHKMVYISINNNTENLYVMCLKLLCEHHHSI